MFSVWMSQFSHLVKSQPFPKLQILNPSKMKDYAEDNFDLMKMVEGSLYG